MFFVFSLFFTALDMISWIYQSDIFPTAIRVRGSSIATATNWSLSLIFAHCSPIALTSVGSNYFYCFVAFNWVAALIVWFWCPETVGRSLEEVEVFLGEARDAGSEHEHAVAGSPKSEWKPRSHLRHQGVPCRCIQRPVGVGVARAPLRPSYGVNGWTMYSTENIDMGNSTYS